MREFYHWLEWSCLFPAIIQAMKRTKYLPLLITISLIVLIGGCGPLGPNESGAQVESIDIKGSDTMVNLALGWAEAYQKDHPCFN
jgi:ABC-type phosphate transport system substrate-binding protein